MVTAKEKEKRPRPKKGGRSHLPHKKDLPLGREEKGNNTLLVNVKILLLGKERGGKKPFSLASLS